MPAIVRSVAIGLFLLTLFSPAAAAVADPPGFTPDFFPLAIGNSWNYAASNYSDSLISDHTVTVIDTIRISGDLFYIMRSVWPSSPAILDTVRNDGLGNVWKFAEDTTQMIYTFIHDSGSVDVWQTYNYFSPETVYISTQKGVKVTVPAGTLGNCVSLFFDNPHIFDEEGKYIFAPNTGLVEFQSIWYQYFLASSIVSAIKNPPQVPLEMSLSPNYPNPFNPSTSIRFALSQHGHVSLKVYDLLGRCVGILADDVRPPGNYTATFHRGDLPTGIYYCRLTSAGQSVTRPMLLSR